MAGLCWEGWKDEKHGGNLENVGGDIGVDSFCLRMLKQNAARTTIHNCLTPGEAAKSLLQHYQ